MVIVDTNIVIDHIRQSQGKRTFLQRLGLAYGKDGLCMAVVSMQELYAGQSTKNMADEQTLLQIVKPVQLLPYTYKIAEFAGKLIRDKCVQHSFADAAIAATAVITHAKLATLNRKDFMGISGLELLNLDDIP